MGSKSILRHKGCGGDVIGVLTGFSMVTNNFGITYSKLNVNRFEFLTDDYEVVNGTQESNLIYVCKKCKKPVDDFETNVETECGCCGNTFSVKNLLVTDYIPLICEGCLSGIKNDDRLIKVLELPARIRRKTLTEVLNLKFKIA